MDVERQLLDLYRDPSLQDKPDLLMQRGGAYYSEAAINLLGGLFGESDDVQVVDVQNNGIIPELPADTVIEVPAHVGSAGAAPLPVPALPPHQAGLIAHTAAYEALTAEAAVSGDREVAFRALLTHPLIGQSGLRRAAAERSPRRQPQIPPGVRMSDHDLVVAVDGGNSKDGRAPAPHRRHRARRRSAALDLHRTNSGSNRLSTWSAISSTAPGRLRACHRATERRAAGRRGVHGRRRSASRGGSARRSGARPGVGGRQPGRQRRLRRALGRDRLRSRRRGHRRRRRQLRRHVAIRTSRLVPGAR